LREMYSPDFLIANAENAAGGIGITPDIAAGLLRAGFDVITLGNHAWNKREIGDYLDREPRMLRPANYPPGTPGAGSGVFTAANGVRVGVANLMGRTFMDPLDDPFRAADAIVETFRERASVSFLDFHAEATSEKTALGWHLDGRVTVVVGTHTHVQTADDRILPRGTAYITDVGMVGPQDSVIGMDPEPIIRKFMSQMPSRFEVAQGPAVLCGVVVDADPATGKAVKIERLQMRDLA